MESKGFPSIPHLLKAHPLPHHYLPQKDNLVKESEHQQIDKISECKFRQIQEFWFALAMLECLKALSQVGAVQCIECLKWSLNVKKTCHGLVHLRYAQTSFELPRLPRPQAVEVFLLLLVGGRHTQAGFLGKWTTFRNFTTSKTGPQNGEIAWSDIQRYWDLRKNTWLIS